MSREQFESSARDRAEKFERAGGGDITVTITPQNGFLQVDRSVEFSSEMKRFLRGEPTEERGSLVQNVVIGVKDIGEITGIAFLNQEKSHARVEFTVIYEPTPLAILSTRGVQQELKATPSAITLRKFDDGWRKDSPFGP